MCDIKREGSYNDHAIGVLQQLILKHEFYLDLHSFKPNKKALIMDQRSMIAIAELVNTIDAPNQYQDYS